MRLRSLAALVVAATVLGIGAPATAAPSPSLPRNLPAAYDPPASYEAQTLCSPSPKPGTMKLIRLIKKTYGANQYMGTSRSCGNGGTSEHKDGRAIDWMTSMRSPKGRANAKAFLAWLVGPDAAGAPAGNATRLGIMYIGWNNKFWAAYSQQRGWTQLDGCPKSNDTTCHRNHMHISLTWDGASGRTSMWDGTVLAPFCASARTDAVVLFPGRSPDLIGIDLIRVLSTRKGLGLAAGSGGGWGGYGGGRDHDDDSPGFGFDTPTPTPAPIPTPTIPCRLHPSGWRGDSGGILAKVTGQGGVPETGVAAVAVTISALGSTAPASLSVWAPGEEKSKVVMKVRLNHNGRGRAVVPVASDGTIALTTSAGGVDINVDVTGYFLPGGRPNKTVIAN